MLWGARRTVAVQIPICIPRRQRYGRGTAFKFYVGYDIGWTGEAVVYQRAIERDDEDDDGWIDGLRGK